jgi:E3 ubiquitin-protein ligase RNF181
MDDDGDWITARYLLSSILGRNPLVVDHVDEESFPVVEEPPRAAAPAPALLPPPRPPAAGVAGTVCAVCTEEIAAADPAARLPCAHWYHHGCIAPWLGIRTTCPLCRAEVPLREDDGAGGEDGGSGRVKPRARAGSSAVRRDASHEVLAAGVLFGHGWVE